MDTPSEHADVLVIGAGQGGGPLAGAFARAGRSTVLVERAHAGGTCVNYGCTPTKTMVASARLAHLARRAGDFGVRTGTIEVDLAAVRERKRRIVESFREGSAKSLQEQENLRFVPGEAAFRGERTVQVARRDGGRERLTADLVIIDTGTSPARPPIPGLDEVPALDSTSIMELGELPEHLVVLGGGYVGLEFGQMFRRFGSRVTIVQRGDQLLSREDADVAGALAEILHREGVTVRLAAEAKRIRPGIEIDLAATDRGPTTIRGTHLLVATGRSPNTRGLGLAAAGVRTDGKGYIEVDERLRTSATNVYALGDVTGGPAFTHISYDDYRILAANLLDGDNASTAGRPVPYTVYTDPQLGRIGLTETEARRQGLDFQVARLPMTSVARAIETGQTEGLIKAVIDRRTRRLLGCAVLGVEGGEIMSALQIAMMGGLAYPDLRDGIFAHPTLAEALNGLFAGLRD